MYGKSGTCRPGRAGTVPGARRVRPQESGRAPSQSPYHVHMTPPADNFVDSRDFARIARAIRFIDENYQNQPRLAAIAARAGQSEIHFNRLFRRWAGLTPKQYLAFVTGSAAKGALQSQPSVLDAAYSVGLSGPGRLHDLIVSLDAMTPGELKSRGLGTVIQYGFSSTPFGRALVATTARGVCHLAFVDVGAVRHRHQYPRYHRVACGCRQPRNDAVFVEHRLDEICLRYGASDPVTEFVRRARARLLEAGHLPIGSIQVPG